jgi:hypothetical protein
MRLQDIAKEYARNNRSRPNDELEWFRRQPTLRSAIRSAGLAVNSEGRGFAHQRRLSKASLHAACHSLLRNESKIRRCNDFDELQTLLRRLLRLTQGIGELYIYDTAFRVGAKLGFLPNRVYLHAGTRLGASALGYDSRLPWIDVSGLPTGLRRLKPYEIEDLLCIYKDVLASAKTSTHKAINRRGRTCGTRKFRFSYNPRRRDA